MQAATAPVCVLTGGPGCGKTTTTKYIVDLWRATGKRMALCAPTGQTCFSCEAFPLPCSTCNSWWSTLTAMLSLTDF